MPQAKFTIKKFSGGKLWERWGGGFPWAGEWCVGIILLERCLLDDVIRAGKNIVAGVGYGFAYSEFRFEEGIWRNALELDRILLQWYWEILHELKIKFLEGMFRNFFKFLFISRTIFRTHFQRTECKLKGLYLGVRKLRVKLTPEGPFE